MLHKCTCGGIKVISEMYHVKTSFPIQYDWKCSTCGKEGIGWSCGDDKSSECFETPEEAIEDAS